MNPSAILPARAVPPAGPEPTPIVLIDGVHEPRLEVRTFSMSAPLGERGAVIVNAAGETAGLMDRWLRATATLVLPLRLSDGQFRSVVLAHGQLSRQDRRLAANRDEDFLGLVDRWGVVLTRPISAVWQTPDGFLFDREEPGSMGAGSAANRSFATCLVNGRDVFVLQNDGAAWRVGAALETLFAFAGEEVSTRLIPDGIAGAPLLEPIDLGRTLGDALGGVLTAYGLTIRSDLSRDAGAILESREVCPLGKGTTTAFRWAGAGRSTGDVLRIDAEPPTPRAEPWIARAQGWLVESTFLLVGGWDPALEDAPDASYARSSDDFTAHVNVYRLWSLNEDGRFTAPPFSRGPAFDLGALFEQTPIRPQPLRFLPCITLDDGKQSRSPLIEVSLDEGATWSAYVGDAKVLASHAAVYFNDATLPPPFLAAARSGSARVRITASLNSPVPVQALRWRGNPFAGAGTERVFHLGEAFEFRRVAAGSIYAAGVAAGTLAAREVDQTNTLNTWLIQRMRRDEAAPDQSTRGQAAHRLDGIWPLLQPGDRVINAGGAGFDPADRAEAIGRRGATVRGVRCDWSSAETILGLVY